MRYTITARGYVEEPQKREVKEATKREVEKPPKCKVEKNPEPEVEEIPKHEPCRPNEGLRSHRESPDALQNSQKPVTFLDLSAEVREIVYRAIFQNTSVTLKDYPSSLTTSRDEYILCLRSIPSIFLSCAFIRKEAQRIFIESIFFRFIGPNELILKSKMWHSLTEIRTYDGCVSPSYNPFNRIKNVHLNLERDADIFLRRPDTVESLNEAMEILGVHMPSVKQIHITLSCVRSKIWRTSTSVMLGDWFFKNLVHFSDLKSFKLWDVLPNKSVKLQLKSSKAIKAVSNTVARILTRNSGVSNGQNPHFNHRDCSLNELKLYVSRRMLQQFKRRKDSTVVEELESEISFLKAKKKNPENISSHP